MTSFISMIVY